jgi:transposase
MRVIFVGNDWAEDHHDVHVMNAEGKRLRTKRLPEGLAGIAGMHELLAGLVEDPEQVVIGIETDRGLWVGALHAGGYQVYAINPLAVARYRDRHAVGGGDLVTSKGWLPLFSANAIESLHARERRAVTVRGHFPTEQAALKMTPPGVSGDSVWCVTLPSPGWG